MITESLSGTCSSDTHNKPPGYFECGDGDFQTPSQGENSQASK